MTSRAPLLVALSLALVAAPRLARAEASTLHVDLGGGVGMDFVLVPAGSFVQGSPPGEKGREEGEREHEVQLTQPYYLGVVPVTVGAFGRFVSATGYRTEAERGSSGGSGWDGRALVQRPGYNWRSPGFAQTDDHPVALVTYDDALAFTAWLSRTHGRAFSLPTEAQWEHAYRAGARSAYYAGESAKDALALGWFKQNAGHGTHPVGQKEPNAFGLHDMAGNVFEWCLDWYAPYAAGALVDPVVTDPDPSLPKRRVLRGGSWLKDASHGRAAARYANTPGSRNADNGFRVAASRTLLAAGTTPIAPEAPPAPTPTPPARARSSSGCDGNTALGLGCFGTVGALLVTALALLARSLERAPVRFQTGADGFKVLAPGKLAGSILRYRCQGPDGAHEGQVTLEPNIAGQFVYTGFTPGAVEMVHLQAPASPVRHVRGPVVFHEHHRHDDSGFQGFPPAY